MKKETRAEICKRVMLRPLKEKFMHYTYKTGGTCSTMIDFDIIDGKLHSGERVIVEPDGEKEVILRVA